MTLGAGLRIPPLFFFGPTLMYWTQTAAVVHLSTPTDTVAIGADTMLGTEKLRVTGAIAVDTGASGPVAAAGSIRGTKNFALTIRANGGGADMSVIAADGSNGLTFGATATSSMSTVLGSGAEFGVYIDGGPQLAVNELFADFAVPIRVDSHYVDPYVLTAVKTSAYNAVICDLVRVNPTGGTFAVTLPTAVGQEGRGITTCNRSASTNAVTFTTTGGQTINGMASGVDSIASAWGVVTHVSDGANWIRFPAV